MHHSKQYVLNFSLVQLVCYDVMYCHVFFFVTGNLPNSTREEKQKQD